MPKTVTYYICPMVVEWSRVTVGSTLAPNFREPISMPNQGEGFLAVFYTREEYDKVHPGFEPWIGKFTIMDTKDGDTTVGVGNG